MLHNERNWYGQHGPTAIQIGLWIQKFPRTWHKSLWKQAVVPLCWSIRPWRGPYSDSGTQKRRDNHPCSRPRRHSANPELGRPKITREPERSSSKCVVCSSAYLTSNELITKLNTLQSVTNYFPSHYVNHSEHLKAVIFLESTAHEASLCDMGWPSRIYSLTLLYKVISKSFRTQSITK
jgi:hypothetical protein